MKLQGAISKPDKRYNDRMTKPSSPAALRVIESDICIVGNGAIAKTAALGLAQAGLSVTLLAPPQPGAPVVAGDPGWDARVYALNHTAYHLLSSLKVWDALDAARVAPVDAMVVHGDGAHAGGLAFDAYGAHTGTLAWIIEDRNLGQALDAALRFAQNVKVVAGRATGLVRTDDSATVHLDDGGSIKAQLVVGADGAQSWVRGQCDIGLDYRSYASAPWSPTSIAKNRTTAPPINGSPAPKASSRCCRCRVIRCRWCGRRRKRWPTRCAESAARSPSASGEYAADKLGA
jgi:2-polyprenyl-6-methoxyphenol hydroxylase-like FAD-dependent oxidoreductase